MASRRKPDPAFTGVTLEQWQSSLDNIAWAQQEPRYRMMLSVALNELQRLPLDGKESESCKLGNVQGYLKCIEVLRSLGRRPNTVPDSPVATFDEANNPQATTEEPHD